MHALFYFLIALALLIIVHEYGHFWVARRCGVKVLRFSVGFGKPLWSKVGKDGTEYVIAMLPFGGYVKMLDEREGHVPEQQLHQTFNRQPLYARFAIVAAGPLANLIFAVFAYWVVFVVGIPGIKPIIDSVQDNTPAQQAQLIAGDEVTSVNGKKTPTWGAVYKVLLDLAQRGGGTANLEVNSSGINKIDQLQIPNLAAEQSVSIFEQLGITPIGPKLMPYVGYVEPDGPAANAGIKTGDRLVSVAGKHIDTWMGWVDFIQQHPDQDLTITIQRGKSYVDMSLHTDKDAHGEGKIGVGVDASRTPVPAEMQATLRYNPLAAVEQAVLQTWHFASATLEGIWHMLKTVSAKDLGGPITIAKIAGSSASQGFVSFVSFLAMISISLGILNLLPIPVLDGGYLAMYVYEWFRGAPLSEKAQMQGQKIGLMILLMLMVLAFYNDLTRLFG